MALCHQTQQKTCVATWLKTDTLIYHAKILNRFINDECYFLFYIKHYNLWKLALRGHLNTDARTRD